MKRFMRRSIKIVNDIPLFKKIFSIFFIFVFIPLLFLSSQFISQIDFYINDKLHSQLENASSITISNFKKAIELAINLAYTIYSDPRVIETVNTRYFSVEEFYDAYEKNIKPILQNARILYPQISQITIYCDNPTILNADGLAFLTDEYKKFLQKGEKEGKNLYVLSGLENEKPYVSIVLNLNFYEQYVPKYQQSTIKKFLRIDLNRVYLNSILSTFKDGHIFIADKKGTVYFSDLLYYNQVGRLGELLKEEKNQTIVFEKLLSIELPYFENWRYIVTTNNSGISKRLFEHQRNYLAIVVLCFTLAFFALFLIVNSVVSRLSVLARHIKKARKQQFESINIEAGKDEIGQVIEEFNIMARKIKELLEKEIKYELRQKELALEKKQAEINALQSQINPHFLFNTLETIRMRSMLKKEFETANAIKLLAKLLKRSIRWENDLITIEEEISAIYDYLEIQKYRFGEKLKFEIEVDEDVKSTKIPKMTIQPLVENACVHGIENSKGEGRIVVKVLKEGDMIAIHVEDNGKGLEDDKITELLRSVKGLSSDKVSSVGLKNVFRRLELFYNKDFSFEILRSQLGGLKVVIKIPNKRDFEYAVQSVDS
ncbi:two-component system sensor histidine kinase YesM [Caldicellulosiruptor bescii]|uniref:Signal transduction histidine kinase, LytS n=3 Tax=Caldicellulosiruptor bescii TaxID=31899 RepID=B9MP60_CALBD|nr:signal transduction histidine kinase, LytS [Caldicellulosiruptor bescii DSM 6725]PBC88572.1 two-component system sensor histidine kinase YesM [Caldicellulosiruptor bescii]PBC91947.1 two-component system sensor histidine kinase YesM [Caldicellulosiruptor bescii]PBD02642.1 two-component system sensor histidine kinase YesM [Caldicellulosiruptor bescii]PBD05130.1 two-component system sensor histidine kinase YesM [Caldicellulosiruptor bescii]